MLLFYDKFRDSTAEAVLEEIGRLYGQLGAKGSSPHPSQVFQQKIYTYNELLFNSSFTKATQKSASLQSRSGREISKTNPLSLSTRTVKSQAPASASAFRRGVLWKKKETFFSTGWFLHYIILDKNILHIFNEDREASGIQESVNLFGAVVEDATDALRSPCFRLTDRENQTFLFAGNDKFDTEEWSHLLAMVAEAREYLPEPEKQAPKVSNQDNPISASKFKEIKLAISELNNQNVSLLSVVNGVRVFGQVSEDHHSAVQMSAGQAFSDSQFASLLSKAKQSGRLLSARQAPSGFGWLRPTFGARLCFLELLLAAHRNPRRACRWSAHHQTPALRPKIESVFTLSVQILRRLCLSRRKEWPTCAWISSSSS